jgi:hypothetical protein
MKSSVSPGTEIFTRVRAVSQKFHFFYSFTLQFHHGKKMCQSSHVDTGNNT